MLIRKNTKAFKTILQIITSCQHKPDREKLVRLYITKAGDSIKERISVEGIQNGSDLFYEMSYQAVLNNLKSSAHQLHGSDDIPGIYFFHSTSNKVWDETPFEFGESIRKEFGSLPDLPVPRKKQKVEKFTLPTSASKQTAPKSNKKKAGIVKTPKTSEKGPRQPDYKLKYKVHFTDLDKLVFRQVQLNKQGVLNYYNNVAEYLLPYLKDRLVWIRKQSDGKREQMELAALFKENDEAVPEWVRKTSLSKGKPPLLLCNDREHLLFYVEQACIEFDAGHSRIKSFDSPDYIVIAIDSPESDVTKALEVALAAKEIFDGLTLSSFVKTDGVSGLHVYIPLDSKSDFKTAGRMAEYLCKLIRLKIPGLVTITGADDFVYGRVTLDYSLNEQGKNAIAPYSLVPGTLPTVAAPLLWEEVKQGLRLEDFNHETVPTRLKRIGNPFEALFKKKTNADMLFHRLEENYKFLL